MKKVNLQLSEIREMLSRDQMKMVIGGYDDGPKRDYNCKYDIVDEPTRQQVLHHSEGLTSATSESDARIIAASSIGRDERTFGGVYGGNLTCEAV